ncbi:MAG: hypothetical protein M0R76_11900 [Proteobacteria bacterium]|nr:hypothetical protein [Pseudomonadota bacterium]
MMPPHTSAADDVLEGLLDLQHDLAKYLRMPVAMLPADASASDLRAALHQALLETRRRGTDTRTAWQLWQNFLDSAPPALVSHPRFDALSQSVAAAWQLREVLNESRPMPPRQTLLDTLGAVTTHLQQLIAEWAP